MSAQLQRGESPVPLLHMDDGEDWLLRPALRRICRYESLKDGTLNLVDVALMNEALDVEAENQHRLHQYYSQKRPT